MTEQTLPPSWAINRACEIGNYGRQHFNACSPEKPVYKIICAFAQYIAETETPPEIDPHLLEARTIAAKDLNQKTKLEMINGAWDESWNVQTAYAALKRGIELGKGETQ